MEVFQLIGIALITAVAALFLRGTKPELSFAVTIAGGIILLLMAMDMLKGGIEIFHNIASVTGVDSVLVKILLKMIGIGYLIEFSAGILNDFGQNSIADKLVVCGKIIILILAIPILQGVLELVEKLLGFIA